MGGSAPAGLEVPQSDMEVQPQGSEIPRVLVRLLSLGTGMPSTDPCAEGLLPGLVLQEGGGAFMRQGLMRHPQITGGLQVTVEKKSCETPVPHLSVFLSISTMHITRFHVLS